MKTSRILVASTLLLGLTAAASAQSIMIAGEDFDGGAVNLLNSSVPALDGGGGDTFAVGATQAWPTTGGTPFSLVDNTVGAVGDTTFFATDNEGVYGVNSNFANKFLGMSDTREWVGGETTASWTFDISGATGPLQLRVGMGSMEGSTFAYGTDTLLSFIVSIDGGAAQTALTVTADASGDGYSYRPLDNGTVIVANTNALLVGGDNAVSKLLAEDGSLSGNLFLDKSPASGAGAGMLDVFATSINGAGSQLVVTLTAYLANEALAIDNIAVYQVPEPSAFAVLAGLAGLLFVAYRRRRAL